MQRIERLLNLIAALLDSARPMTAEEIRTRIAGYDQANHEAFRRAFERDKEALRAMGIPLEVRTTDPFAEQADAYTIPKARYYLPRIDFDPDEVAALQIAAEILLGAGEQAGAALLKLSIDTPPAPHAGPRVVWGADLAAEQPLLAPLYAAQIDRRRVTFGYTTASGVTSTRTVEPYRLLHRSGHWYVVGRDIERDAVRAFRVSRITTKIEVGEGGYAIPADFDAAAHLGEAWEIGDSTEPAIVRFDAAMRWWPEQNMSSFPQREAPGGALEVEIPMGNVDALVSWVIGFAGSAEIVSPDAARRRLRQQVAPFVSAQDA